MGKSKDILRLYSDRNATHTNRVCFLLGKINENINRYGAFINQGKYDPEELMEIRDELVSLLEQIKECYADMADDVELFRDFLASIGNRLKEDNEA